MTGVVPEPADDGLLEGAPCGYVVSAPDGTILQVNRAFETISGVSRAELIGRRRFADLLSVGGRIYHETHFAPLLSMQGQVGEIALDIARPDGTRVPVLVNAIMDRRGDGRPERVRAMVFDSTERRRYEHELLEGQRREQEIARELQRSLLGGVAPADPRLELAVGYRPADSAQDVGGDWHDAFWIVPGEVVGLVVGDVVGRGITAAAAMGQLRSALRALALAAPDPGALLTLLDAYAERHRLGRMATVVYAQLDLATRELRYACAGHPPPALLYPGAPPAFAWDGRSLPLDAAPAPLARPTGTLVLPAGTTVLLYSDGIVERRGQTLDAGMEHLLTLAAARAGQTPRPAARVLVEDLVQALHEGAHADDVCLLAATVD